MGSFCSCLSVDDIEDYANPNNHVYRNCVCLSCLVQNFSGVYASIFRRGELHRIPSSIQGAASMTYTASLDNSLSGMYHSPPRPLPYDADPRSIRSRLEKGSSHSNEESQPLSGDVDGESETFSSGGKWNECAGVDDGSK